MFVLRSGLSAIRLSKELGFETVVDGVCFGEITSLSLEVELPMVNRRQLKRFQAPGSLWKHQETKELSSSPCCDGGQEELLTSRDLRRRKREQMMAHGGGLEEKVLTC